jgi:hypothetical protein
MTGADSADIRLWTGSAHVLVWNKLRKLRIWDREGESSSTVDIPFEANFVCDETTRHLVVIFNVNRVAAINVDTNKIVWERQLEIAVFPTRCSQSSDALVCVIGWNITKTPSYAILSWEDGSTMASRVSYNFDFDPFSSDGVCFTRVWKNKYFVCATEWNFYLFDLRALAHTTLETQTEPVAIVPFLQKGLHSFVLLNGLYWRCHSSICL